MAAYFGRTLDFICVLIESTSSYDGGNISTTITRTTTNTPQNGRCVRVLFKYWNTFIYFWNLSVAHTHTHAHIYFIMDFSSILLVSKPFSMHALSSSLLFTVFFFFIVMPASPWLWFQPNLPWYRIDSIQFNWIESIVLSKCYMLNTIVH